MAHAIIRTKQYDYCVRTVLDRMFSKKFLTAFVVLCVLAAGAASASSEVGWITCPSSALQELEDGDIIIYEGEGDDLQILYSILMGVGEERKLKAGEVRLDDEEEKIKILPARVLWRSSDPAIAGIAGQTGDDAVEGSEVVVEAPGGEGVARIIVYEDLDDEEEGDEAAYCMVYVQNPPVPVEEVIINKDEISILHGYTGTLTASVMPPHAEFRHITWYTSNPEIIQIDPATRIGNRVRLLTTGLQPGTAYISAVSNYRGGRDNREPAHALCTVHHFVEGPAEVEGGCSAQGYVAPAILLLLSPLLFFLKK